MMILAVVAAINVYAETVEEAYSLHPTAYSIFCLHEQIEQEPDFKGKWLERIAIDVSNQKIYLKFYDEAKEEALNLTNTKTGIAGTNFYYTPKYTIGIDTKDGRVSIKQK